MLIGITLTSRAQGTLALSNLGERGVGYGVGDSIQAFLTGSSSGGYILDSVTLEMGAWLGYANDFTVGIYTDGLGEPGTVLGSLSGSRDPEIRGEYVYTASNVNLSPSSIYWIMVSSQPTGTPPPPLPPVGGYAWQVTDSPVYVSEDGWRPITNGSSAGPGNVLQFGIEATPIPEPATLTLVLAGATSALALGSKRRPFHRTGA